MTTLIGTQDDICVWPDGTWCYRYELSEMSYLSDDFEVISYDDPMYAITQEAYA